MDYRLNVILPPPDNKHKQKRKTRYRGRTSRIWETDLIGIAHPLLTIGKIPQYYNYCAEQRIGFRNGDLERVEKNNIGDGTCG